MRFIVGDDKSDIVCQSSTIFPASTGEGVLAFFRGLRDNTIEEYAKEHPEAAAFLQEDRKTPKNFGTQSFYSINAFKFTNAAGESVLVRYRWVPLAGRQFLTESELAAKDPNFLFDELPGIFAQGPISFKLVVQIAGEDDITDDCTKIWPEDRRLVELGTLTLNKVAEAKDLPPPKQLLVYSVVPGVPGIEPSADPILAARSAVYKTSGQTRRDAEA